MHAWVNPFRVTSAGTLDANDLVKKNAGQWIIQYNNGSFTGEIIDPGYPEAREYVLNVLMEIINNYDIDGIVMDDYFYPYGGTTTEDAASKALHKPANVVDVNQDGDTDDDWRRSNVDVFLKELYDRIQAKKPWVRFGMGTFGIWTTQSKVAQAYGISLPSGISGLDDYDEQACNPVEWVKNGYVDYINPQLYWPTTSTGQNYNKLCQWWAKDVCEHFSNQLTNGKKVHFFSSQSISSNRSLTEIQAQVDANRSNLSSGYTGSVFFDTDAYLTMDKDLMTSRFATNALTPPMDWKSKTALSAPTNLTISGTTLTWQHATAERFTVYVYPKGTAWSTAKNDPSYLQGVIYGNSMDISGIDTNANDIAVCAYDRYGVEHTAAVYSNDSGAGTTPNPETIIWELNGGEVNTVTVEVPSLTTLEAQFKNDYNSYFGASVATTREITNFLYYGSKEEGGSNLVYNMMNDPAADWTWLRDYIISKSASNTTIQTALLDGTDAYWRYRIVAFLTASAGTNSTYTVDFSIAGQPSKWGTAYQIAHGAVLLPTYVTSAYTLPTPVHPSGYEFLGCYDNAEFVGSPLTTIPANWTGTLYAQWQENAPTIDPTWQILYTSSNDSIVTPYATDVFGANIVSNTYENGVGTITFDGPVTSIGDRAFSNCTALTFITIPNSVTIIGDHAFRWCYSLTSITIPNSVMSIGVRALSHCTSLTSITIPNSVTSIGFGAFDHCSLISIIIPNSVTSIGENAFRASEFLESIFVESGNTTYDSRENCNAIIETATNTLILGCQNTVIPNSVTSVGDYAFRNCSSMTSIEIPNSVTSIGKNAFSDCSSLASIIIPNSVESIGYRAFYSCSSLTSVTIPNNVTSIGGVTFFGCTSLCFVTIGSGVKSIGWNAFSGCSSLDTIYVEATTPPALEDSTVFRNTPSPVCVIPCGTLAAYEASDWASQVGGFVEDCVEGQQIYYTSTDGNIVTPNATDVFGANIVSNIYENGVGTITFEAPITSIGDSAFYQCKSLASITIPNNVTSIGKRAFHSCYSLTSVTIPNGVTSIGNDAFYDCDGLISITIPNSVTSIGGFAFGACSSITSITIPNSVVSIKNSAFAYCSSLISISIPSSVTSIGERICEGCSSLISIVVEESNKIYDSRMNCNAIIETATNTLVAGCQNTIIPHSVMSIGDAAFSECSSLNSIIIPNSVTTLGCSAFYGCVSLTSIGIPSSITKIGVSAFSGCYYLDTIYVEATTPPTLGEYAFTGTLSPVCVIPCGTLAAYEASDWASQVGSFVEDCVEGQQIYYTSTDGNIVTPNVNAFDANIVSNIYENGVGTITFEAPITIVGDSAFHECSTLTSITIPNGVTKIKWAFEKCTSLESVELPDGITTIGDIAFHNCSSLRSIDIPNSVTYIGGWAFGASAIESLIIPTSVTHIGVAAFTDCNSLRSIVVEDSNPKYDSRNNCNAIIETATNTLIASSLNTIIPNTVTTIATRAFQKNAITSIDIPNSVVHIEAYAFRWATQLNSITIPNSVNYIGDSVFYSCPLDTIRMEAMTPPTIGVNPFSSSPVCVIPCGSFAVYNTFVWASQVGEFVEEGCAPIQMCGDDLYWEYADGVLTITGTGDMYDYADDKTGPAPWYDVRGSITTINMPNEMTKIGDYAFYKCTEVTSINMPTTLTTIGEKAFAQDTKLACEIILPASMTTIASRAFFNCQAVTAFHIEATTPPTIPNDAFERTTAPIHVPCGYGHIYGKHAQWGVLNLEMCELLQDNVYYYPIDSHTARAVTYHSNPTDTIVIPSAVVIDGVPRTVTEVADFAFTDCANLPAIYFSEGLEYIGERAFVRCYGLQGTIVLPATLETIGERAFSYCNNVDRYTIQAMTPPVLGANAFTGDNKNALFYISCEAMDDYKVATNWSSLKSRLRDACLNIYHYNTALGANGVHTTEDTLVASIYYRRKFTPYRWETLYLPFEVDRVTVLEDGLEYDLTAWDIVYGGHYFLAKPDGMLNKEILFGFTDELESHTPYIIQFSDAYYTDKLITFYGKESWNKLSTSFEVLSSSAWMQIAGNTTLQDQLLEKPVYMLRSGLDFILQKTTTTLHPFECYVMPYATSSGAPARMNVRFRGDVPTAVESVKGNESHLTYSVDGYTLTVYPQGQAFSIYSLNGALIYSCEAGKEAVDCELNSGCYLLHAGAEAHKIML